MKPNRFSVAAATLTLALLSAPAFPAVVTLPWKTWQDSHFTVAKKEQRFILLDLEAVWCHWCHVMEQKTYSDPRVAALIAKHYIPVKVDQDARPDLGKRYEDYGWPATIVFRSVTVPSMLSKPPALELAELPLSVELITVIAPPPAFAIAPPLADVFVLKVELVTVIVP